MCWFPFRCYLKILEYPEVLQPHFTVAGCMSCTLNRCVFAGRSRALAALFINLLTANGKQERFCWYLECFSCYEQWWCIREGELGDAVFFFQSAPLIAALLCSLFSPQVNVVFLNVSSSGSECAEIVIRIENVIRIMSPLFCVLFFPSVRGSSKQQQSYWSCLKEILLPCISQIITKLGFSKRI